jgi:hypothetical protein
MEVNGQPHGMDSLPSGNRLHYSLKRSLGELRAGLDSLAKGKVNFTLEETTKAQRGVDA